MPNLADFMDIDGVRKGIQMLINAADCTDTIEEFSNLLSIVRNEVVVDTELETLLKNCIEAWQTLSVGCEETSANMTALVNYITPDKSEPISDAESLKTMTTRKV